MDFSHFDANGNATMVDVGAKQPTARCAIATGSIQMSKDCYQRVRKGETAKGDVLGVARIAGIMAVKQTPSLIPLCHTLLIEKAAVDFSFDDDKRMIFATCTVRTTGTTGVEMEALTGASLALLTIYDMCKAMDKNMRIDGIHLVEKTGGKSGHYTNGGHLE